MRKEWFMVGIVLAIAGAKLKPSVGVNGGKSLLRRRRGRSHFGTGPGVSGRRGEPRSQVPLSGAVTSLACPSALCSVCNVPTLRGTRN